MREHELALRLLPLALVVAPLFVLRGHVDFARLPQQAFVQVAALFLGLLWVGQGAHGRTPVRRPGLDLPLVLFLGWSAASLVWATDPGTGLRTLGHWAACAVVYGVVSRTARASDVPRLAGGLLLGGAAAAAVGLGQALLGLDLVPQAAAPAATLANRSVAAGYVAAVAPLALLAWSRRPARVAAAVAATAMLAFLPFTRSRSAAVAVALQLVLLAVAWARGAPREPRWARRASTTAVLAASLALLLAAAWITRADPAKARSASIRWTLAGSALSMALDRPLLGVGLGGFGALHASHAPVVRSARGAPLRVESPHNESLQVLAETGLPGLLAGVWVAAAVVFVVRRLRRSPHAAVRQAAFALGLSLVGFAVDAAFGFPLRYPVPPFALAVLLGLLAALDADGLPTMASQDRAPSRLPARPLRLAVAAGSAALLTLAWSSSRARLQDDRARYVEAFLPVAHAQGACGPGVTLDRTADGRLDLSARAAPLTDILRCLVERTGLRVEYDGAPPRQPVSVTLRGDSLAGTLESLLEGLGVNYLLGRDPSGTAVERLIVFGSSRAPEPARGGGTPARAGQAAEPVAPPEPLPDDESQPVGPPPDAGPGAFPAFPGAPGSEPAAVPEPGEEIVPEPAEPQELTPLTLQLSRRPGSRVARSSWRASGPSRNRNGRGS